jgi:CRP-like cAMP-binding protein
MFNPDNEIKIETILKTQLFNGFTEDMLRKVLPCLNPRVMHFKKGESIVFAGSPFTGIGIVNSGEIVLAKESIAGNRMILNVLKEGDMFGEMVSFSEKKVWPASATAQSDCTIVFVSPEKVITQCDKYCSHHTILINNLLHIMSKKALQLNRKVEYLTFKSLRSKLSAYLLEMHKTTGKLMFVLPMNREELADFFNVARPSISRELVKMKDEGLIDFHKSTFKITNLEAIRNEI